MREAPKPGRVLRQMRATMLRQQDAVKLEELRHQLKAARARRAAALRATVQSCKRGRQLAAVRVVELRAKAKAELAQEVKRLRQEARNRCQARRHAIRSAGGRAITVRRLLLAEERQLQKQLKRLADDARKKKLRTAASSRERRAESDDYVRGNLPAELLPVFERVKKQIKGSARRTRTEAFLEWASEHPEDVLLHQQHVTDREVAELVREHEATAGRLRKGRRHYNELAKAVPF